MTAERLGKVNDAKNESDKAASHITSLGQGALFGEAIEKH